MIPEGENKEILDRFDKIGEKRLVELQCKKICDMCVGKIHNRVLTVFEYMI